MLRRAVVTALVVGPVLTAVNQADALFADAPLDGFRALLTALVPFVVSLATSLVISRQNIRLSLACPNDVRARLHRACLRAANIRDTARSVNGAGQAHAALVDRLATRSEALNRQAHAAAAALHDVETRQLGRHDGAQRCAHALKGVHDNLLGAAQLLTQVRDRDDPAIAGGRLRRLLTGALSRTERALDDREAVRNRQAVAASLAQGRQAIDEQRALLADVATLLAALRNAGDTALSGSARNVDRAEAITRVLGDVQALIDTGPARPPAAQG